MPARNKRKIVILGSGNLAWHLVSLLHSIQGEIIVYNRNSTNRLLSIKKKFHCRIHADFNSIERDADIYFVCVSDRYISKVSAKIRPLKDKALVIHCSGSQPIEALKSEAKLFAVLYPLQSFTSGTRLKWKEVPVLLQSNCPEAQSLLDQIAKEFPGPKRVVDNEERLRWHLAAVWVNNFTNALYAEAFHIVVGNKNRPDEFKLLLPLMQQGLDKLKIMSPARAQTGPARRRDLPVLAAHRKLLKGHPELLSIYNKMSRLIMHQQLKNHA